MSDPTSPVQPAAQTAFVCKCPPEICLCGHHRNPAGTEVTEMPSMRLARASIEAMTREVVTDRATIRNTLDEPDGCACTNAYACSHRCWHCGAARGQGCESWCHIRPFEPAPAETETSSTGPGARWRVLAYGGGIAHHVGSTVTDNPSPHAKAIPLPGTGFDEIAVGSWLHVEQMDDHVYWMNVGGVTVHVTVRDGGSPEHVWVAGPDDYDAPREGCGYELSWTPYEAKREAR